jgi:hypothetical protein
MSLGQETPSTVYGSVSQGENCVGIVSFMLALLYNPMYTWYNQSHPVLEATGVELKDGEQDTVPQTTRRVTSRIGYSPSGSVWDLYLGEI